MKDTVLIRRKKTTYIFTIISLLLIVYTIYQGITDYLLEQKSVSLDARIESIEANTIGYSAHVVYKVEGKTYDQYHVDLGLKTNLTVGDTTKIKYDINNPSKLIKNNHLIILVTTGSIGIILLIIFLPKILKIANKQKSIKFLKKEGKIIIANVQDVIVNQRGKKNKGFYPYCLRANYLNEENGQTMLYQSDDSYINPNDIIAKYQSNTVTIYVDKTNPQNYYLDISSLIPKVDVIDPRDYMKKYFDEKKAQEEATSETSTEESKEEKKEETK